MASIVDVPDDEGRLTAAAQVDRWWRLATTGMSFALFGIGGLAMALVFFPALRLCVWSPQRRAAIAQASVHNVWRFYIEAMRVMGVLTFDCKDAETLRNLRGVVVVANHPTLLDVVFLMAFMRRTRAVVKAGVWRNPFMSGVVLAADYIPNLGNPRQLVDDCAAALSAGANLVIFPEGSRTPDGQTRQYQRGFAYAAVAAGAPVQIVTIHVSPPTLRKGEPWHSIPRRRPHWSLRVHGRIDVAEQYRYEPPAVAARKLTSDVADQIERFLKE